jgi:hypothetical protein
MNHNLFGKIGALAAGALAMYYLDPQMGAQRRALLADLVASGMRGQPAGGPALQARLARRTYHRAVRVDPQADAELRASIEARLGRLVSHPRALDVRVDKGVVRLSGDVLAREREGLLLQVQQMPGVLKLVNATTAHETPEGITQRETREEGEMPPQVAA